MILYLFMLFMPAFVCPVPALMATFSSMPLLPKLCAKQEMKEIIEV